MVSLSN